MLHIKIQELTFKSITNANTCSIIATLFQKNNVNKTIQERNIILSLKLQWSLHYDKHYGADLRDQTVSTTGDAIIPTRHFIFSVIQLKRF